MQCFSIAREFNFIQTPTVKSVQNSGGMERKHRVRKPRLRARRGNSSNIHSPRSESKFSDCVIKDQNTLVLILASLLLDLLELLGIRYFSFDFKFL